MVRISRPACVNAVFACLPRVTVESLQCDYAFYVWDASDGAGFPDGWPEVCWMTSFDTAESEVREFAAAIRTLAAQRFNSA